LPTVHVNNANLSELKNACDDAVKKLMQSHQFTEQHQHTDVRLVLGWLSVFIAAGSSGWSYKVGFEESKTVVTLSVLAYAVLYGIQMLYSYYIEGHTIYVGKRKSLSKRIETEVLRISARTIPSTSSTPPLYKLAISYRRSSNNNKSLIRKCRETAQVSYGELVDEKGGVEETRIGDWLGELIAKVVGEDTVTPTNLDGKD